MTGIAPQAAPTRPVRSVRDRLVPRVLIVVCDSWGVGGAPDAAEYGDQGSDTLGNTARAIGGFRVPALEALGLGSLTTALPSRDSG